jgi:surface antigen
MSSSALRPSRLIVAAAVGLLLVAASTSAAAQAGIGVLKDTPADNFNEEDMRLFSDAMQRALDTTPADPAGIAWANPKTTAHGRVTNEASFTWRSYDCRRLLIENEARGQTSHNQFNLCRVEGRWRAVSPSELGAASAAQ